MNPYRINAKPKETETLSWRTWKTDLVIAISILLILLLFYFDVVYEG